jgi:hypothetical protein
MLVEISGDELYFQTISRVGLTVDSGMIQRVAKAAGAVSRPSGGVLVRNLAPISVAECPWAE